MRCRAYGHTNADSDRDPYSDLLTFHDEFSWARDSRGRQQARGRVT